MKTIFLLLISISLFGEIKTPSNIEPSGITYLNGYFYVASDNGYVCSFKEREDSMSCSRNKNRDFEGITNNGKELIVAEEGKENILYIDNKGNIKEKYSVGREFKGQTVLSKKGDGFEGLTFVSKKGDKEYFFVSNQSDEFKGNDKSAILFVEIDRGFFGGVKTLNYFPMQIKDISDLFFKDGLLYVLSDTEDSVYIYKFEDNYLNFISKTSVPGKDQEGFVMVNGRRYIAQDSGGIISF